MSVKRILVAVDGSLKSMPAVDYIGKIMSKQNIHDTLFHVLMKRPEAYLDFNVGSSREDMDMLGEWLKKRLVSCGFNADLIFETILKEKLSRAEGIFSEARDQGFGTILAGRKGLSDVSEFVMGRVTRKILFIGSDKAVWIV
jgi:nucleotide-binding universal stress UspA family protein